MNICIFGSASNRIDPSYITAVESLGEKLAKDGHSLIYGAGSGGLMGASARGFYRGKGKITGIVPEFFKEVKVDGELFDDCTTMIFTDTMRIRKQKMENMCDIFVVVPGGLGTFDEVFEILTLRQLNQLTKEILFYNINGYYDKLFEFLESSKEKGFIAQNFDGLFKVYAEEAPLLEYISKLDIKD